MTCLQWDNITRRTAREVHPNLEPYWIENLCRVALTGEPAHVTGYIQAIGRYLEISAFCPVPGRFGCLLADITERWRMEEVLHSHLLQLEAVNKELYASPGAHGRSPQARVKTPAPARVLLIL